MKEIVTKILDVIMFLVPFFGKRKRNRIVREVRFNATHKEVCNVKTTEREKDDEKVPCSRSTDLSVITALLPVSIATSRRRMWTLPIAFGAFRVGGIIIISASRDR